MNIENVKQLILLIATAVGGSGLIGIFVGSWLTRRQADTQRKLDFCEKQLRELYSPLVGIRKEIRILSEFRLEGEKASHEWWKKVCEYGKQFNNLGKAGEYYDKEGKKITTQIEYESDQLKDTIIPAYKELVTILKEHYWLAEEETRTHFPTLIKFVETWERFLSKTHPADVLKTIQVKEGELTPFYEHIETTLETLRDKLRKGNP